MAIAYVAIGEHAGETGEPFAAQAGEPVRITGGADLWQGRADWVWVWCCDLRGRAGFVPQNYLAGVGPTRSITADYTARELPLRQGQRVQATLIESGWAWSQTEDGRTGWAPLDILQAIDEPT